MGTTFLLFPHQLFKDFRKLLHAKKVYLIEEHLFFTQYKFHKQKLALHRASMKYYENYLHENNIQVQYIEASNTLADCRELIKTLETQSIDIYDVCDNWLQKKIVETCKLQQITCLEHETPLFINTKQDLALYFGNRKKYFQTDFYILQRKQLHILINEQGQPYGGKWSFDVDNRLKYPSHKTEPLVTFPAINKFYKEAVVYINKYFSNHYGHLTEDFIYPTTHQESEEWLNQFFNNRFHDFGAYEDAIVAQSNILHHSVISPMLNIGLLLPMQVVDAAIAYAEEYQVPTASLEGFIRQIIGWREFIRGVYAYCGTQARTMNYWKFSHPIPPSFYTATTQIIPIDITIQKLLHTGYNHHIERLMVLGNFLMLCECNPHDVYRWFMEMYVDAYDWVMVPNVYGMSQFADGGIFATKPYISGSNYILKMSNFSKGSWTEIWDALFWNFMHKHRNFFSKNPRLGMLLKTYDKMSEEKKNKIKEIVHNFQFQLK